MGQPVDQQTQHQHQAEGRNPLRLLYKDRGGQKEGIFEKTEAALHTLLVFVGLEQLLVGELRGIEHVGSDEEGCLALHRTRDGLLVDDQRRGQLPRRAIGKRALAWSSRLTVLGMRDELGLYPEPLWALLELLREGGLGIRLTGEALVAQMPQGLLPLLTHGVHLALERRPGLLLALRRAHDHPAFPRWRLRRRRPQQRVLLLPGSVGDLQRGARLLRGIGDATDPANPGGAEPP